MTQLAELIFNTPRQAGEIDLIALVRGNLAERFTEETIVAHFDSHPLIAHSVSANSTVQKTNLTRYWNQQLLGIPNNQSARLSLIPSGDVQLWYKLFCDVVLPFCCSADGFRKVH